MSPCHMFSVLIFRSFRAAHVLCRGVGAATWKGVTAADVWTATAPHRGMARCVCCAYQRRAARALAGPL